MIPIRSRGKTIHIHSTRHFPRFITMRIIYSISLVGFATSSLLDGGDLDKLHIGLIGHFTKTHCKEKVINSPAVWDAITNQDLKRTLLNAATSHGVNDPTLNRLVCNILGALQTEVDEREVSNQMSLLSSPPNLMKAARYPPPETYISEKCQGLVLPIPIEGELRLAIHSFSVSQPDEGRISNFCDLLRRLSGRYTQIQVARLDLAGSPSPNLMESVRYSSPEDFISQNCDELVVSIPLSAGLRESIQSFSQAHPNKAQIAELCGLLKELSQPFE